MSKIKYSGDDTFPYPSFYCDCGHVSHGWSICLKCNPQTYKVHGMTDDSLDDVALGSKVRIVGIERALAPSVFEVEIWNKAIEAAAKHVELYDKWFAKEIRKLKK